MKYEHLKTTTAFPLRRDSALLSSLLSRAGCLLHMAPYLSREEPGQQSTTNGSRAGLDGERAGAPGPPRTSEAFLLTLAAASLAQASPHSRRACSWRHFLQPGKPA